MLRFEIPVPGIPTAPRRPDGLALSVRLKGPSLKDFDQDLMPRSVILNPAIVLSKLKAERLVMGKLS
jgi:hypothetical protein